MPAGPANPFEPPRQLDPHMNKNVWRARLVALASAVAAVWLGGSIAQGELFWPLFISGLLGAVALAQVQPVPMGTLVFGGVVFGYIVGNRGFAQISIAQNIPLLPAEFALMVSGGILIAQSAMRRELPVRRDSLNAAILLWMTVSSVRLYMDMKTYGVMALRDYATVYYAAFFFLAQRAGAGEVERRFITRCLTWGFTALIAILPFYERFPEFFLDRLVLRGTPVIYFKDDLLGMFLAAGSVLAFSRFERTRSRPALALSLLMAAATMTTNNRASMLGLILPAVLLAVAGRPRFLAVLGGSAVAAALILFAISQARGQRWENTPLHDMYERVASLADPYGQNLYSGEETSNKGDNNAFRSTWWRIIIGETVGNGPWFGMGWGNDLAEPFIRVYYPEGGEDFGVRSPHNILVTLFARTGVVGLLAFLGIVAASARKLWRAIRANHENSGLWCAACTIFTSACFGVVLEGPMGAVVFWTLLGIANSGPAPSAAAMPSSDPGKPRETSGEWPVAKSPAIHTQSNPR
jgi:O-antigen ligase